jgi:hypothetical protein
MNGPDAVADADAMAWSCLVNELDFANRARNMAADPQKFSGGTGGCAPVLSSIPTSQLVSQPDIPSNYFNLSFDYRELLTTVYRKQNPPESIF